CCRNHRTVWKAELSISPAAHGSVRLPAVGVAFGSDRSVAVAGDGHHRAGRLADRFTEAATADDRLRLLSAEQPALGALGLAPGGLGTGAAAVLSRRHEPARPAQERKVAGGA